MKYIYDLTKLQIGDIILKRDDTETSNRVRVATNSDYSHAMLYVGSTSYIDAGKRVRAKNLQRYLFDDPEDTCVLRVKKEFLFPLLKEFAVFYVRSVVGNPYAYMDAFRMERGEYDKFTENKQICTRLVAKGYALCGLKLVDNVEMCTPQQLLESEKVEILRDCYREATDFDMKFAATYDVTEDMADATDKMFSALYDYSDGRIRSIADLNNYIIAHSDDDKDIAKIIAESGYLNVLELDEIHNKYNYDVEEFKSFYGEKSMQAAYEMLEENRETMFFYDSQLEDLLDIQQNLGRESQYFNQQIDLYKRIKAQHRKRERNARYVLNSLLNA